MNYQNVTPSLALRAYVEEYTILQSSSNQLQSEGLPPGGRSGLILNLGTDSWFTASGLTQVLPRASIGGQMTRQMYLTTQADATLLLITFRPTGFYRLFGLPMVSLTDQVVDLEAVFPLTFRQQWRPLIDQLLETETIAERIQLVEALLLTYVNRQPFVLPNWVDQATSWLAHPGNLRVQELAADLRISTRQLSREFSRQVGISPKSFAQVMRFRNVFRAALTLDNPSWQDLVHIGGWYDQAHFCNDLYQITGMTPSAFFTQQHATAGLLISNPDELRFAKDH